MSAEPVRGVSIEKRKQRRIGATTGQIEKRRRDAAFEQAVLDRIGRSDEALLPGQEAARIRQPALLLWCRDDKVIDVSAAETFRRGLRESTTVLLSGCGHMPLMAQPRQVAEAVAAFLAPA